jgi:hypothetical protein
LQVCAARVRWLPRCCAGSRGNTARRVEEYAREQVKMRLLDPGFRYVPSANTNVTATWKRFGYRPTTDAERRARQSRMEAEASTAPLSSAGQVMARASRRRPLSVPGEAGPARLRLAVSE